MSVLKIKDENTGEFIPIPSIKGDTGDAAGFGTVSATVDANHGTPSVTVTASGEDTAKNFAFEFKNLQPAPYDDSVLVARMDSFTNLAEGSTTGDAELIDGRTGADGVAYTNIGGAIRGQVTDLKSDYNDEIGAYHFKGINAYVTLPLQLIAGKTYFVQKYSGQCGIATRATSDGANQEVIIPAQTYKQWFSAFTPTTSTNFIRVTADSASTFTIFDADTLAWMGRIQKYADYEYSGSNITSVMYPINSGTVYRIETTGLISSIITRNVDSESTSDNIETVFSGNTVANKSVVFAAESDAKFLRVSGSGSWSLNIRVDDSTENKPLIEQYGVSDFIANKYFDLPQVGQPASLNPENSGVGNGALSVNLTAGMSILIKCVTLDGARTFGFVNKNGILKARVDSCINGYLYTAAEDGTALITSYIGTNDGVVVFSSGIESTLSNGLKKDIYAPYPQLPADSSSDADLNSETCTSEDIYNYIDDIKAKCPQMITKELLGKDETNTYNIYRYIVGNKEGLAPLGTIFIGANEHGPTSDPRECAIVTCRLIKDLCMGHAKDNDYLNILKKYFRFVIIPIINPYGFNNNTRNNGNDVNINRNYPTPGWSVVEDADKGSSAGSEVETQYVVNTISEYSPIVALDLHCLGYVNSANDNKCHWAGYATDTLALRVLEKEMKRDYGLTCTDYGVGNYNTSSTGDAYFNYIGIKGFLLEFNAREGATSDNKLHTPFILEANYTFMLRAIDYLLAEYNPAYKMGLF